MFKNKTAQYSLQDLLPVALLLVVAAIGIAVGADVLDSIQSDYVTGAANCNSTSTTACGYAYNITNSGLEAQDELGSWLDTIALIVAAAIIIGVLVTSFMISNR